MTNGTAVHDYAPWEYEQPQSFLYPDYPSGICAYCGQIGDERDHLLPLGYTGPTLRRIVPVVPACRECNVTLAANYLPDLQDRRDFVQRSYRHKYRRVLRMLVRTEEGLEEMGPTLRGHVQRMQIAHEELIRRLAWPTDPNYDADAWAAAWEEPQDAS